MLKNNTVKNKTNNTEVAVNLLANFQAANVSNNTYKTTRKIICSTSISKQDKEGIISLYEALVPRKELKLMDLRAIHQVFSEFENIDVDMILKEAFPKFEETIGEENFAKVKKYFGIGGCKPNKNMKSKEIEDLISRLRTIENAQYYICGYKDLIIKVANLLDENEEEYSNLIKAKLVRLYAALYLGYYYFTEDFACFGSDKKIRVDYAKLQNNNKMGFYPEELFVLYMSKFSETPNKNILYEMILFELSHIKDKKILKEVLEFSELDIENGKFVSLNKANPYQNFGKIRGLKMKLHYEVGYFPIEIFGMKEHAEELDLASLFTIYKILRTNELKELKEIEIPCVKFEGSRIYKSTYLCYEVTEKNFIGGEIERERCIRAFELFAGKSLTLYLRQSLKTRKELKRPKKYNMGQFLSAIKFVNEAKLVEATTIERDFEIADKLLKMDKEGTLTRYGFGEISIQEVKSKLGIDEAFEFEFFGLKPKIDHKEVIAKFALKNGYVESESEIIEENNQKLIENLVIYGNEEFIEQYNSGEIDEKNFKEQIGFNEDFSEMFFNLSKVDVTLIEEKLLEVKRSTIGKKKFDSKFKLIILLYCYIMDGQIACGPKNRVPKRNKALKTSILKTLV